MATRMQQRRGTSSQWASANTILAAGEIGFETDTGEFRVGDGTTAWADLSPFKNIEDLGGNLDDYIPLTQKAQDLGVATLDGDGSVPLSQLATALSTAQGYADTAKTDAQTFATNSINALDTDDIEEGTTNKYFTDSRAQTATAANIATAKSEAISAAALDATNKADAAQIAAISTSNAYADSAIADLVNAAPGTLDTLNELAAAIGDDPSFAVTVANLVSDAQTDAQDFATNADSALYIQVTSDIATAVTTAEDYADSLAPNYDVAGSATNALSSANAYTDTHAGDSTNVHGIADTAALATKSYVDNAVSTYNLDTTNVHGIADTSLLETLSGAQAKADAAQSAAEIHADLAAAAAQQNAEDYADGLASNYEPNNAVSTHNLDTTDVHGIADTSALATKTYADNAASTAQTAAEGYADTVSGNAQAAAQSYADGLASNYDAAGTASSAVSAHNLETTNVHGIADTSALATKTYADNSAGSAQTAAQSYADGLAINYEPVGAANTAVGTHDSTTTNVHGIADTAALATKSYADNTAATAATDAITSASSTNNDSNKLVMRDAYGDINVHSITAEGGISTPYGVNTGTTGFTSSNTSGSVSIKPDSLKFKKPNGTPSISFQQFPTANDLEIATYEGSISLYAQGGDLILSAYGNDVNIIGTTVSVNSDSVVTLDATQTLTNKAITAPTLTGTTSVEDLEISGALTFSGTATQINTENLSVTDSLIYLAAEQYDSDVVDIGIYGAYGDSGPGHLHTGLIRDASDGKWKLISGGDEPTTNVVDFTGVTYDTLKVGNIESAGATLTGNLSMGASVITMNNNSFIGANSGGLWIASNEVVLPANTRIGNVSAAEIGYLDGATSALQTQLDAKAPSESPTFTGSVSFASATVTGLDTLPSQSGNNGKYLTTDGTNASWATLNASPALDDLSDVAITSASTNDVVYYNGTSWVNKNVSAIPTLINAQSGTTYTLTLEDSGKVVEVANASAIALSVPTDASVDFPVGTQITIIQTGVGQITVAAATPATTTVNYTPGNKLRAQWSSATLIKRAANTWVLIGDLA